MTAYTDLKLKAWKLEEQIQNLEGKIQWLTDTKNRLTEELKEVNQQIDKC